jgi:kexin
MTFWGSVIDPAQAKVYDVPVLESTLPPLYPGEEETPTPTPEPTTSKTIPKPTAHLPDDHDEAPGEAHKPTFPGSNNSTEPKPVDDDASPADPSVSPTSTPTPDEGWFSDMSNLMTNQAWIFVAFGAVVLFGVGVGLFFWRRSVRRRQNYTSLPGGDDMAMNVVGGSRPGPRSKELYAAFDEASDDEDADEETGLRRGPDSGSVGLGYHSGFLDDDDPASADAPPTRYKDEPEPHEREHERAQSPGSGDSSGSGDWEHASQEPSS